MPPCRQRFPVQEPFKKIPPSLKRNYDILSSNRRGYTGQDESERVQLRSVAGGANLVPAGGPPTHPLQGGQ